jgi:TfoX/Sxy family transcriptional regulator of competence genes
MSTQKETVEYILDALGSSPRFTVRAMFGEYALYADKKVVALICDDQLYVKILPESEVLGNVCDVDAPYKGARPHYVVEESQLTRIENLPDILLAISASLPMPKKKIRKSK